MFTTIYVCTHALKRWRQRVAVAGDAPKAEVADALRSARRVPDQEPLAVPVTRLTRALYYRRDDLGATFVVERIDDTSCRVLTVVADQGTEEAVLRSKRSHKPERPAEELPPRHGSHAGRACGVGRAAASAQCSDSRPGEAFRRAGAAGPRAACKPNSTRAAESLDPGTPASGTRVSQQRLREAGQHGAIYREDGVTLEYDAAIHHLLRRVEELQAQVEGLRSVSVEGHES